MRNHLPAGSFRPLGWLATSLLVFLFGSMSLKAQLSGAYTIDASQAASSTNYTSFSAAAAALVSNGVSGPVTFTVAAGSYTDTLYLPAITGASASNTITFDGGDSATTTLAYDATATGQNAAILLDGADHVTITNLKITHSGTDDAWGLRLANRAEHNSVDAVAFDMTYVSSFAEVIAILGNGSSTLAYSAGDAFNDLTVSNCMLKGGYYGARFEGSGGSPNADSTVTFSNCHFLDNYGYGAYFDDIHQITLDGNTIDGIATSSKDGFYFTDIVEYTITGNTVLVPDYGIYISDGNFDAVPSTQSLIANNFLSSSDDEAAYFTDFEDTDVFYNTFYTGGSSTSAYGVYLNDPEFNSIQNNIFYGTSSYALYSADDLSAATSVVVDYNIYYTVNGANLIYNSFSGGTYADLASWQTANPGLNVNSLEGDPIFSNLGTSVALSGTLADGAATPIAAITLDIDGDARNATTPDIGADEFTPASCLPASGLSAAVVYADSALAAWVDNNTGSTFSLEYGATGFTPGSGTTVSGINDTSYTITGLSPQTSYDFYVTADCGAGGTATQAGPGTFTTGCAAIIPPSLEDFSAGWTPDACWEQAGSGTPSTGPSAVGSSSWTTDGFANNGSSGAVKVNIYASTKEEWMLSPTYDIGTSGTLQMEFDFGVFNWNTSTPGSLGSDDEVQVLISTDMGLTWTAMDTIDNTFVTAATGNHLVYSLSAYTGMVQFAIWASEGSTNDPEDVDVFVDNFEVRVAPACAASSALQAINITDNSADLTWAAGDGANWGVEYGPAGFTPGSGTSINATNDTISISGLMSNTSYDFYVTDSCGAAGTSTTSGPASFTTSIAGPRTIACTTGSTGALFTEEFDNSTSFTGNINNGNGSWLYDSNFTGSSSTGPSAPHSGSHYIYVETSTGGPDSASIVSPAIDLSAASQAVDLSFWLHAYGQNIGTLKVGVSTSASGPFTTEFTYGPGELQTDELDPFQNVGVNLDSYLGQTIYIEFRYIRGSSFYGDLAIDLVEILTCQSCLASTNLSAFNVTPFTADLTWTAGSGTNWAVEYGPSGFTPGSGTSVSASNDTITLTGLMASTAYDFYVTDSCGGALGASPAAGPGSFTTAVNCPATETLPFMESFDANAGCFTAIDAGGASGDTWAHTVSTSQNLDGTGYMRVDSDADGNGVHLIETLESPVIDASTVNNALVLEFDHYYRWIGPDSGTVQVYDGSAWINVATYTSSTGGWSSPSHEVIDVTAYANANFQVRFLYDDGNTWAWYWGVDNFSVEDKCLAQSLPYTENFDTDLGCFTTIDAGGASGDTWTQTVSTSQNLDGTGYVRVDSDADGNGVHLIETLVSPVIDASNVSGTLTLTFDHYYRAIGSDSGVVEVWDGTTWNNLATYNANTGAWGAPAQESFDITAYANSELQVRFVYDDDDSWAWYWSVDNFSIADIGCLPSTALQAFNITTTSADLTWTAGTGNDWVVEYGVSGFTPGSGTIINATNDTISITGLMPSTAYDFYVTDSCGMMGSSPVAGPGSFNTLCAPVNMYPYVEDFDGGVIPVCYSETSTSSSYTWRPNTGGTTSGSTGPSGDATSGTGYYMYVEASSPASPGDSAYLYTPEFDMTSLSNPEIVYAYHMYGADIVNLDLQAYDRTSMTWVSLNNIVGQQQSGSGDAWLEARVPLAAYTTDTALQLRFFSERGASFNGDAAVDDIMVREIPPCVDPSNFMVVTATSNSVSLSWDSDTNIVASTIQYGAPGFSLGSGTNVAATPGGFTVSGLAGTTCYDFYVKDSCSAGTNWVGPVTACTIATCSVSSTPSSTTNDTTDCDGGPTNLSAMSSTTNDLVWIDNGIVRETGMNYTTDSVSFTTPFDVSEYVTTNNVSIGPMTNIAASGFGNFSNGQWITVDDTIHIDSMTVRHQNDVVAFVQIVDAAITTVLQRGDTFTTPAGVTGDYRVPVNMVLTPGVYFMNVDFLSGSGSLFRATGGANYPYDVAGLMSIDSTNFSDQSRIYYTFDLSISKACIGPAAQALAVVPGANAGMTDTVAVCSTESAVNLAGFLGVHDGGGTWIDDDATGALTDSIFDATAVASGAAYNFTYIVPGSNGCAGDTAMLNVSVEAAPDAGIDTTALACQGSGILILRNYITGNRFAGTWVDLDGSGALGATGSFNTNNATAGVYRAAYILSGTVCDPDTAIVTVDLDDPVSAGLAASDTVCDDEAMVDLNNFLDASATAGGTWSDLSGTGALSANIFDATAVSNGATYSFQYKVSSNCGDDSVTVDLFVEDCDVSLRDLNTGFISIYPNPTKGIIKIDDDNVKGEIQVELFSASGALLVSEIYNEHEEIRLDISDYAVGVYTIKVSSSKGLDVKRVMKH